MTPFPASHGMRRLAFPTGGLLPALLLTLAGAVACTDDPDPAGPPTPSGALRFVAIDAGYYSTCALTRSGAAFCWGLNVFGALGDGTRETRLTPTRVEGGHDFDALDAGAGHACGLNGGAAWCWGHNDEGQAGDGSFAVRDEPVAVTGGHAFASISAGHAHTCGLTSAGEAWCWGDDSAGQLGDGGPGATPRSAVPVHVVFGAPFRVIHAGYYQTCALDMDGAAWCWGANADGQNGDGSDENRHLPVAVAGGRAFSVLAPGDRFVCGVSAGQTWCWGSNEFGQLGVSPSLGSSIPVLIDGATGLASIRAVSGPSTVGGSRAYVCGVRADGSGLCWGGAVGGIRGANPSPTELDRRIRFDQIAPGPTFVCGLSSAGYAYCGGANGFGQLGDGTSDDREEMVPVAGPNAG